MKDHAAGRRYVAALTGMRGIAACLVFLYHYAALHPGVRLDQAVPLVGVVLQFPFGFGFAGVDIFFVLSGFLITTLLVREREAERKAIIAKARSRTIWTSGIIAVAALILITMFLSGDGIFMGILLAIALGAVASVLSVNSTSAAASSFMRASSPSIRSSD